MGLVISVPVGFLFDLCMKEEIDSSSSIGEKRKTCACEWCKGENERNRTERLKV